MREVNLAHCGYLDGLRGTAPDPELQNLGEYAEGWLHGNEDRENGVPDLFKDPDPGLKRGATVKIPKGTRVHTVSSGERLTGRGYHVQIHDVYQVIPAYRDRTFIRPVPAKVVWPGTGGYWSTANARDVELVTE